MLNHHRVLTANLFGNLGSFGRGEYVLMRQIDFPDSYDPRDQIHSADHDRIMAWHGLAHVQDCCQKYTGTGDMGIGNWAKTAAANLVLDFCVAMLQADPTVQWTGCRILGTVNRSNGYVVWSIQVFAKHSESNTKVYSGTTAPNVQIGSPDGATDYYGGGYHYQIK